MRSYRRMGQTERRRTLIQLLPGGIRAWQQWSQSASLTWDQYQPL